MGKDNFDRWWNSIVEMTIKSRYQAAQLGWLASWWYWGKQGLLMGLGIGIPLGVLLCRLWRG